MGKRQDFIFSFTDSLLAEVAGVSQRDLHFDLEAICRAYENIIPLAKRLGVSVPQPRLAGFCYTNLAALGAKIEFNDFEPSVIPMIQRPEQIDNLKEPDDYLQAELIQKRLCLLNKLKKRYPDTPSHIGHLFQGPVTTAVLLMGRDFLMLPYDDPDRAHRLLHFCVKSALNYAEVINEYFGKSFQTEFAGLPDDFAGMFLPNIFKEFVVPYWENIYKGIQPTTRILHSELLRVEHMPFLEHLKIDYYDPGADQYLTPELLQKHCSCRFMSRIQSWHMRDLSAEELRKMYRYLSKYGPYVITFSMERLVDEPKIRSLLEEAQKGGRKI